MKRVGDVVYKFFSLDVIGTECPIILRFQATNLLYFRMSWDYEFLIESHAEVVKTDDFTRFYFSIRPFFASNIYVWLCGADDLTTGLRLVFFNCHPLSISVSLFMCMKAHAGPNVYFSNYLLCPDGSFIYMRTFFSGG